MKLFAQIRAVILLLWAIDDSKLREIVNGKLGEGEVRGNESTEGREFTIKVKHASEGIMYDGISYNKHIQ